ncbi:MAG: endonuclease MutS2 [Bryobacteraceae bacterium]
MAFHSIGVLQFAELLELLATYAGSDAGRELILSLEPHSDRDRLEADLAEAGEAIEFKQAAVAAPDGGGVMRLRFDDVRDVSGSIRVLQVGGARLDGPEILDLFHTLSLAGEYRGALLSTPDRFPRLAQRGRQLADLRPLARRWSSVFLPDGSLTDDASVALRRIRRDIEKQKSSIQDSLQRFMRAHRQDGTLQEDFVTIRDDRYVVPIVAGQKGRVDGVIHGSSGTGRTLYVEPLETINLNNQLVRLREDELREIDRILLEITDALREHNAEIASTAEALAQLDFVFAKATFASQYNAIIPSISKDVRRLVLRDARHPLLETVLRKARKPIVPISFELSEEQRCLLISGPNTGGKTVTMKTAGLLALMVHAGLPVPCSDAEFPLLDNVLADIGDSQSIEESLSSFSGHLIHVKEMLEQVTPESLVLLDELGRATDPEEGGALGVAVLDEFRKSGSFCLASTHLLPLKLYGAKTPGVVNASMGFNEATLEPTYQLRIGVPGKSAGLDIATRLRMPAEILAHARAVMPRLQADFQALLSELHEQVAANERREREMEAATQSLRKRQTELERETIRREEKRQREWKDRSDSIIADFEARAQMTVERLGDIAQQRKAADEARRVLNQTKREFREEAASTMAPPPELAQAVELPKLTIEEGSKVRLKDVREIATVRRLLKNGALEVEAGLLRMQVSRDDVVEVLSAKTAEAQQRLPKNVRVDTGPRWDVTYRELNVIGQRADEAAEQVDKFLDSAVLASVNRVRIVHGHGMGILKRAVADLLQSNPHVGRFYPATPAEGGAGATIVELRE